MLQLTRSGTLSGRPQNIEELRGRFARRHGLIFRELLDRDALAFLLARLASGNFNPLVHQGIKTELCLADSISLGFLYFLTNNQTFFDIIREVTGCPEIGCFEGRVYRMVPGKGHHDSWHSDLTQNRMIGMSINLGIQPYSGGVFQMRDCQSKEILFQAANTGLGDALVFRIREDVEHMVTSVEGEVEKTAFAGWFKSSPKFSSLLAQQKEQDQVLPA
jgi:hypothetical protein